MASFDIVNKIDLQKIDNAVNTAIKELVNRYDLKDEDCEIELDKKNKLIKLQAKQEMAIQSLIDVVLSKLTKQQLDPRILDLSKELGLDGERGEGLLRALKLNRDIGPEIVERARNLEPIGLLLNSPRPNLIRFMPALNISREELKQMVDLLRGVIKSIK
jgi:uncharacterized protein YajQ (UPF0234 family)